MVVLLANYTHIEQKWPLRPLEVSGHKCQQ